MRSLLRIHWRRKRSAIKSRARTERGCELKDAQWGSAGFLEPAFLTPANWICNPAIDVGFMPARAVAADLELGRERALGDLAVDGGPGQPGPGKDGFQPDDTVWLAHGCDALRWSLLTSCETREAKQVQSDNRDSRVARCGVEPAANGMVSNSKASASAEIDAMDEGQILAEPAA